MVVVVPGAPALDPKVIGCWTAQDETLGLFVVFMGHLLSTNATQSSSRIQAHVFSIAGLQSFPRLTLNPSSELYGAVAYLPEEDQGDETRRGLAVSLLKYFSDMPKPVQQLLLTKTASASASDGMSNAQPQLFNAAHAAALATRMQLSDNAEELARIIAAGMSEKSVSWIDVDVVLPDDSISLLRPIAPEGRASLVPLPDERPEIDYGPFNTLVHLLGETAFLPTSRLRRAPSKPTAVSKTRVLDADNEDGLRREMQEMVATEQSYVSKLSDLEQSIAANYVRDLGDTPFRQLSAGDQGLRSLFPSSLFKIIALNERFLTAVNSVIKTAANGPDVGKSVRDPTGVLAFSKVMLEHLPHFKDPYQDYLKRSSQLSNVFASLLADRNSPWANAVIASGEQRLKSWLIEPVQRLPRYSLFIDNMVNILPADHPATSRFLRARDVITDICALEDQAVDHRAVIARVRDYVNDWPQTFNPKGRLITAIDAMLLSPPFDVVTSSQGSQAPSGNNLVVLLLFADELVFLNKTGDLSSRGLLAELDRASQSTKNANSPPPFAFFQHLALASARFLESSSGRLLHVNGNAGFYNGGTSAPVFSEVNDVLQLMGSYDSKAAKVTEEICLSLIEHRYPEKMREADRWTLRSLRLQGVDSLGMISAVILQNDLTSLASSGTPLARVRIEVDSGTTRPTEPSGRSAVSTPEALVKIAPLSDKDFRVEVLSYGRRASVDKIAEDALASLLLKRLGYLLRAHSQPFDAATSYSSICLARDIAMALESALSTVQPAPDLATPVKTDSKRFRPFSPVKGLATILGSGTSQSASATKLVRRRANSVKEKIEPTTISAEKSVGSIARRKPLTREDSDAKKDSIADQLTTTFDTYIVALRTRKGNVVGRVIHKRDQADELAVNELYNILIQDPLQHQAAAEVPVDVLFAAFEKFLRIAWTEKAGMIVQQATLDEMQNLLFSGVPGMEQQFKSIMSDMSRLNQQAFKSLISVLADLVSATSNDGDRGALIMTFAEVLVSEGDPVEYIMLFDRLLAEANNLFGIQVDSRQRQGTDRSRVANTGSVGSTTSSITKKLGFFSGLSRGNSKASESESRVAQVFRQLSKRSNAETESTPPSLSRSLLSTGRSADSRPTTPGSSVSRPGSAYSGQNADSPRPGSAHGSSRWLAPITGRSAGQSLRLPRKKRRSSLSDLPNLRNEDESENTGSEAVTAAARRPLLQKTNSTTVAPAKEQERFLDEVQPLNLKSRTPGGNKTVNDGSALFESRRPELRNEPGGLAPLSQLRATETPVLTPTRTNATLPRRMKVQSLQKLQERLQSEKKTITSEGQRLQAQFKQLSQDVSTASSGTLASKENAVGRNPADGLASTLAGFESSLRERLDDLGRRTDEIRADYESSLAVSENKAKGLDELYREANVENELLYDRFNEELNKILGKVKGSSSSSSSSRENEVAMQEMRRVTQEAQDEAMRLRKENQRLKRENLGLRSQLRG